MVWPLFEEMVVGHSDTHVGHKASHLGFFRIYVRYWIWNMHTSAQQFSVVCEGPNPHWVCVGDQAPSLWAEALYSAVTCISWMMIIIIAYVQQWTSFGCNDYGDFNLIFVFSTI